LDATTDAVVTCLDHGDVALAGDATWSQLRITAMRLDNFIVNPVPVDQ
jgi:hypothetical protein